MCQLNPEHLAALLLKETNYVLMEIFLRAALSGGAAALYPIDPLQSKQKSISSLPAACIMQEFSLCCLVLLSSFLRWGLQLVLRLLQACSYYWLDRFCCLSDSWSNDGALSFAMLSLCMSTAILWKLDSKAWFKVEVNAGCLLCLQT